MNGSLQLIEDLYILKNAQTFPGKRFLFFSIPFISVMYMDDSEIRRKDVPPSLEDWLPQTFLEDLNV